MNETEPEAVEPETEHAKRHTIPEDLRELVMQSSAENGRLYHRANQLQRELDAATARAEKAEAALAEMRERLGKPCDQWGVRLRDNDPDEDVEIMSSDVQAHVLATAWRGEIPETNPTVMMRARYEPGPWRVADTTPPAAPERAADEQGVREGGDS